MRTKEVKPELSVEEKLIICRQVIAEQKTEIVQLRRFRNRARNRIQGFFKARDFLMAFLAEEFPDEEVAWELAPSYLKDTKVLFQENGHDQRKASR
jgi:hypothetical protein